MAAGSMGAFGAYKHAYSRHTAGMAAAEREIEKRQYESDPDHYETVWVIKRYKPTDLRVKAPAPRHKPLVPNARELPVTDGNWIPSCSIPLRSLIRDHEQTEIYSSRPSTRCESWSTLREMLPSRGRADRSRPPNWGTGFGRPPSMDSSEEKKFLHRNNPMTRYVDHMHTTNRLFRLY